MLSHIFCTSGLQSSSDLSNQRDRRKATFPTELTKNAIFALSFHDLESIKHKLFALQVINVKYTTEEYFNFEEKK